MLILSSIAITGLLLTGSIAVNSARADHVPNHMDGNLSTLINEVVLILTDPTFGLEEIKNEVRNIEGNVTGTDSETIAQEIESMQSEVSMIKNSIYVPFKEVFKPGVEGFVCDHPGNTADTDWVIIDSDKTSGTFMVNSIVFNVAGASIDEDLDTIVLHGLAADSIIYEISTDDFAKSPVHEPAFEILGREGVSGIFPNNIVVESDGSRDIILFLFCNAQVHNSITFETITVSGWKQLDENITISYQENTI